MFFFINIYIKRMSMFWFLLQLTFHLVAFAVGSTGLLVCVFYVGRVNSRLPH